MIKTIMFFAIASVLIIGTLALGNTVFAVSQGDVLSFKGTTNKVVVDPTSSYPQKAQAKVGIQMLVENVYESGYDGQARMALEIKFKTDNVEPIIFDPDDAVFSFLNDGLEDQERIIPTTIQDTTGRVWEISGQGSYDLGNKEKARAEFTLNLVDTDSNQLITVPVQGGIVWMPIGS